MPRLSFLSIAVVLGMAINVQASIVELTFGGTYEVESVQFGEFTESFSFSMTYDTSLDTNTHFFATGVDLGGDTTTHEWHGYSASGITAVDIEFNGIEFSPTDIDGDKVPADGINADFWFDVDLATGATPTLAWLSFANSECLVQIGGGNSLGLRDTSYFFQATDDDYVIANSDSMTITRTADPDPIPEPASMITWTLLGVVGCIASWWNRRRKAG